ncbi:MAG: hypothetical protein WEF86_01635 [Gemmatimonadota bacterium]
MVITRPIALLVLVLPGIIACAGDGPPETGPGDPAAAPPSASASASASPSASPTALPQNGAGSGPVRQPQRDEESEPAGVGWTTDASRAEKPEAGAATLSDVRTARHDGFDRVVLDFDAGPVPGHVVAYGDGRIMQCGSGAEVHVPGAARLRILLYPANAHTEEGLATVADRDRTLELPNLRALRLICDFEAQVEWVAGVASQTQYRVFELSDPARLVVDIRHAAGS